MESMEKLKVLPAFPITKSLGPYERNGASVEIKEKNFLH